MDLEEWELLPVDGFLDFGDGGSETVKKKKKKDKRGTELEPFTIINVDLDYFRCPSLPPNQPVPVRIQLDPPTKKTPDQEIAKSPPEIDQDTVSQVFFKKQGTEFVDMKILDASPRSGARAASPRSGARAVSPPIESFRVFEDKVPDTLDGSCGSPRKSVERDSMEDQEIEDEEKRGALFLNNILKWSFTGIGALCSFGAAAATVCILIIGNHQRNKKQNQKLTFQIYTDDKRINKVVHQAAKLNEAISAISPGADSTFGGYYDGLL